MRDTRQSKLGVTDAANARRGFDADAECPQLQYCITKAPGERHEETKKDARVKPDRGQLREENGCSEVKIVLRCFPEAAAGTHS